jgi:hypothetical protein
MVRWSPKEDHVKNWLGQVVDPTKGGRDADPVPAREVNTANGLLDWAQRYD